MAKDIFISLDGHKGEQMMTEFSFFSELPFIMPRIYRIATA